MTANAKIRKTFGKPITGALPLKYWGAFCDVGQLKVGRIIELAGNRVNMR
jgi:hypothetical protein